MGDEPDGNRTCRRSAAGRERMHQVAQLCPEEWSGKGGTSGGPLKTGVAGLSSSSSARRSTPELVREGWFEGQSTAEIWIRGIDLNCRAKRSRPDSPSLTLLQLLLTLASRPSQLRKNISTILIRESSRMIRPLSTTRDHSRGSLGNRESQERGKG